MRRADRPSRPRAAWWVRAGVWVVFALALVTGSNLTADVVGGSGGLAAGPYEVDLAATSPLAPASDPSAPTAALAAAAPQPSAMAASEDLSNPDAAALQAAHRDSPMEFLPAWRWRSGTADLFASYGLFDGIAERPINGLASLLFALSGWIWWILLGALNLSLSLNPLENPAIAKSVDSIFTALGQSTITSGLVVLVLIAALVTMVGMGLRGRVNRVFSTGFAVIVPLAILFTLVGAGGGDRNTPGNPIWIADQGMWAVDAVAGTVGTAVGDLAIGASGIDQDSAYANLSPSCVAYMDQLYGAFNAWRPSPSKDLPDDGVDVPVAAGDGKRGAESLKTISKLWENAVLSNWMIAQYGGVQPGSRIYCHQLEGNVGTPRAEQVTIGTLAGYPSVDGDWNAWINSGDLADDAGNAEVANGSNIAGAGAMVLDSNGEPKFFDVTQFCSESLVNGRCPKPAYFAQEAGRRDPYLAGPVRTEQDQAKTLMWAACYHEDGAWKYQPAWEQRGSLKTTSLGAAHCGEWWYTGVGPDAGPGGAPTKLVWQNVPAGGGPATSSGADGKFDTYDDVSEVVAAFRGSNTAGRALNGLITLLTSAVYMYVLGGIAIGTLVAKVGFLVMLVLLPGTLLLLAMPSKDRGRNPAGVKMLRMTGGYLAANFILTATLTILLAVIAALSVLANNLPLGGGAGLLNMLVPLAALFVLRKVFKSVGLGDVMSTSGALGMSAMAAKGMSAGRGNGVAAMKNQQANKALKQANKGLKKEADAKALQTGTAGRGLRAKNWAGNRAASAKQNLKNKGKSKVEAGSVWATGHSASDWKRRLGATGKQMATAGGAAAWAQKKFGDRAPAPLRGALAAAAKAGNALTGWNPERASKASAAQLAAAQRREEWDATTGLTGSARESALNGVAQRRMVAQATNNQRLYADDGVTPLLTESGENIFGVYQLDANGNVQMLAGREGLAAAGVTIAADGTVSAPNEGYSLKTAPLLLQSSQAARAEASAVAAELGIDANKVIASGVGLDALPLPDRVTNASNRNPLPQGLSVEAHLEALGRGLGSLSPEMLHQLHRIPTETGQNYFLHSALAAAGMYDVDTGARLNYLEANGIDPNSEFANIEAQKQINGEESVFDDLPKVSLPAGRTAMLLSAAMAAGTRVETSTQTAAGVSALAKQAAAEAVSFDAAPAEQRLTRVVQLVGDLPQNEADLAAARAARRGQQELADQITVEIEVLDSRAAAVAPGSPDTAALAAQRDELVSALDSAQGSVSKTEVVIGGLAEKVAEGLGVTVGNTQIRTDTEVVLRGIIENATWSGVADAVATGNYDSSGGPVGDAIASIFQAGDAFDPAQFQATIDRIVEEAMEPYLQELQAAQVANDPGRIAAAVASVTGQLQQLQAAQQAEAKVIGKSSQTPRRSRDLVGS